jgi:hypothetical protein
MSKTNPEAADAEPIAEGEELDDRIAALKLANDVEGLLALAKQFRSGTGGVPRDMRGCFEAYRAAAELGSPVAQHAAGLFFLNGGVVARDDREAALCFRAAADQGHVAAKMLVANLYELGIHYRADAAKADVWYRNAARAAGVEHEPGTPEHQRAMAELGAVRYCLELAKDAPDPEKARLLKIAKTYGHRPPGESARDSEVSQPSILPGLPAEAPRGEPRRGPPEESAKPSAAATVAPEPDPKRAKKPSPGPKPNIGLGATAFLFSLVFAAVGLVAGHVLRHLGLEQIENGQSLPVVGKEVEAILPLSVGVLAVLPNLLVYRLPAFVRGALVGGAAAIAGEVLWGMGQRFLESRAMQVTDFGAAGLLVGLLIFGLLGGASPGSR